MEIIVMLTVSALMGYWCYSIAKKKEKDMVLAFFMGFLFGIWAVIVYALLKPSKEIQRKQLKELLNEDK